MLHEVKIKTKVSTADGQKDLAELFIVKAENIIDAEAKVRNANDGKDFEVCHVKQTKITDIIGEGTFFFSVKAVLEVLDEKSGNAKLVTEQILVAEEDFDHAKDKVDKYLNELVSYVKTIEIKETKITDYYE